MIIKVTQVVFSVFLSFSGMVALSTALICSAAQAQGLVFDEAFESELTSSGLTISAITTPSPTPAPVGFGPDYTVSKSGNGTVTVTVTNTEEYVVCFIVRDGVVVGAGAKKRNKGGNTPDVLEKDGTGFNVGKGPAKTGDTLDCN